MAIFTPYPITGKATANEHILARMFKEIQKQLLGYNEITVTISGSTQINHLLNRQPSGWFVVDKTATADVWRVSWSDKVLVLKSSTPITCKILVY